MKNDRLLKNIIVGALVLITFWFGIKPLITGTSFKDYARISKESLDFGDNEYATIVIGSEPEGIASALACGRTGLKTLIITGDDDLGSYIKKSMISQMSPQPGIINKKKTHLNQGIYEEIFGEFTVGFSSRDYEKTVNELISKEKSIDVLYGSHVLEAVLEGGHLKGIFVQQADGKRYYTAEVYIDATKNGQLLSLCGTPSFKGSSDLGLENFYSPLEFNFLISGVNFEELKKSQKTSDFESDFKRALWAYEKVYPRTKLVSPSFISQNNNEVVISGLKIFGVDVEDQEDIKNAFKEAEDEARMLTAYLKASLVAFKDSTYKESPMEFFIPEYKHFEGRYKLTVSDILENKNFKDKIALCAEAVDAGKFVNSSMNLIVTKPNVYSIPIGCIIPSNLENVLMTGSKASFSSLAATSAGSIPTSITIGEAAGLVAAYCFINKTQPADLIDSSEEDLAALAKYVRRGGVKLEEFSESIMIPKTEMKLADHWAYPYVKILTEYGLITGGEKNDYKLDYKASQDLFAVLLKNAILKMAPDVYNLDIDSILKPYEVQSELTGEILAEIVLKLLDVPYESGKALETLTNRKLFPENITEKLGKDQAVTTDVVLGSAVETVKSFID